MRIIAINRLTALKNVYINLLKKQNDLLCLQNETYIKN